MADAPTHSVPCGACHASVTLRRGVTPAGMRVLEWSCQSCGALGLYWGADDEPEVRDDR